MQEYTVKRRRFVFEGNDLLRFSSSVPKFEGYEQIGGFYAQLSELCERWCEEVKFPELCEILRRDRAEGRALPRRMLYSLNARVTQSSDKTAEVRIEVFLSDSARDTAPRYTDTQLWELSTQSLLPSKTVSAAPRKRKREQ